MPPRRYGKLHGFTLLEVALVLAILVIIAALAWPALRGPLESQRLRNAGDQVRTICAAARNRAIVTGQTHVFRCQVGTGQFQVHVYEGGDAALEATNTTSSSGTSGGLTQINLGDQDPTRNSDGEIVSQLPEGIIFQASHADSDARGLSIDTTGELAAAAETGASPLFFYPDGTTSTAEVTLADSRGQRIDIELRGLTGATRAGTLETSEESPR